MMRHSVEQGGSDVPSPLLRGKYAEQTKDGGGRDEQIHEMGVYNSKAGTEERRGEEC